MLQCIPDIVHRESIDSTNNAIKQAICEGSPEGTAVVSREQTGGYGRQGRTWVSPQGGLYCSLLLRPFDHGVLSKQLPTLSLVVSLAIRQALCEGISVEEGEHIRVKWPNDILYHDEKLVGISLEVIENAVCVGFGINVFNATTSQKIDGKNKPAYYADVALIETADQQHVLHELASTVIRAIGTLYCRWVEQGFSSFTQDYNTHAYLTSKTIRVENHAGQLLVHGIVQGCDKQGNLLVLDSSGALHPMSSGEAHLTSL